MRNLLLILLLALSFASYSYADDDDEIGDSSAKDDQQIYYLYDGIDLTTNLKYDYPKAKTVIKSVFPLLQSEEDNEEILNFNNIVLALLKLETDDFKNKIAALSQIQGSLPKASIKNDLAIDYASSIINADDEHLLSIRFSFDGMVTGLSQGYHYYRALNYDLESGEALALSDLFLPESDYLQRLSDYCRNVLARQLPDKSRIAMGTEPSIENFKTWNLKPKGLVITFDVYQVAPHIYGAQTVTIPYKALQDILDPESAIAPCLKHQKKCERGNLLTGGFIDEV